MATLDELAENTEITDTDLVHTRDGSGLDHKVSGDNLRKTVGAQTSTLSSNTTINLSNYKSGLVVIADTGSIELTFTNTLNDGYTLIIISQADDVDIIIEGDTTTINENDVLKYVSDNTNMISLDSNDLTIGNDLTVENDLTIGNDLTVEGQSNFPESFRAMADNFTCTDLTEAVIFDTIVSNKFPPMDSMNEAYNNIPVINGQICDSSGGTVEEFNIIRLYNDYDPPEIRFRNYYIDPSTGTTIIDTILTVDKDSTSTVSKTISFVSYGT